MRLLLPLVLVTLALHAEAAMTADFNLDRLRQAPEAADVQARLDAMLSPEARERLEALAEHFDCDPRRDLHRVVVSVPEKGAPTLRLIGLPAARIAAALAERGEGRSVLGGLTGYPLPNRPNAVLVALGPDDALIGRADLLAEDATRPATLPPMDPAVAMRVRLIPNAVPRAEIMTLVHDLELVSDGLGQLRLEANAHDETSATELVKRYGAIRELSGSTAALALPGLHRLGQLLEVTTLQRDGDHLTVTGTIPADLRRDGIDRLLARLEQRAAR